MKEKLHKSIMDKVKQDASFQSGTGDTGFLYISVIDEIVTEALSELDESPTPKQEHKEQTEAGEVALPHLPKQSESFADYGKRMVRPIAPNLQKIYDESSEEEKAEFNNSKLSTSSPIEDRQQEGGERIGNASDFINRAIAMLKDQYKDEWLVAGYNGIVALLGYAKQKIERMDEQRTSLQNELAEVRREPLEFAKWLEEFTEVIKEPKITLYRYNGVDGWGNYILDDIYAVYKDGNN